MRLSGLSGKRANPTANPQGTFQLCALHIALFCRFVWVPVYIYIPLLSLSAIIVAKSTWVRMVRAPMITTHMQILKQIPVRDDEFDMNIEN